MTDPNETTAPIAAELAATAPAATATLASAGPAVVITSPEAALIAAIQNGALTRAQVFSVLQACEKFLGRTTRTAFDAVQATEPPKKPVVAAAPVVADAPKGLAPTDPLVTRRPKPPIE